jgi:hypothetical protein
MNESHGVQTRFVISIEFHPNLNTLRKSHDTMRDTSKIEIVGDRFDSESNSRSNFKFNLNESSLEDSCVCANNAIHHRYTYQRMKSLLDLKLLGELVSNPLR